jgi:Co/Zn/Cd efflux system component
MNDAHQVQKRKDGWFRWPWDRLSTNPGAPTPEAGIVSAAVRDVVKDSVTYGAVAFIIAVLLDMISEPVRSDPEYIMRALWSNASTLSPSSDPGATIGWVLQVAATLFVATQIGRALDARKEGLARVITVSALIWPCQFFLAILAWMAIIQSWTAPTGLPTKAMHTVAVMGLLSVFLGLSGPKWEHRQYLMRERLRERSLYLRAIASLEQSPSKQASSPVKVGYAERMTARLIRAIPPLAAIATSWGVFWALGGVDVVRGVLGCLVQSLLIVPILSASTEWEASRLVHRSRFGAITPFAFTWLVGAAVLAVLYWPSPVQSTASAGTSLLAVAAAWSFVQSQSSRVLVRGSLVDDLMVLDRGIAALRRSGRAERLGLRQGGSHHKSSHSSRHVSGESTSNKRRRLSTHSRIRRRAAAALRRLAVSRRSRLWRRS